MFTSQVCLIWLLCAVFCSAVTSTGEYFTSTESMEILGQSEQKLIKVLEDLIILEDKKIQLLRRHLAYYKRANDEATSDITSYVNNPINGFLLMKRLTTDWHAVESLITNDVANMTDIIQGIKLPQLSDLRGASVGISFLQDMYLLTSQDLALGIIKGTKHSASMTASDCLQLGLQRYDDQDWYHSVLWLRIALRKHFEELDLEPLHATSRALILDHLAYATNQTGNVQTALALTKQYLQLTPDCARNIDNVENYITALTSDSFIDQSDEFYMKTTPFFYEPQYFTVASKALAANGMNVTQILMDYESLCRGEIPVASTLRCRYVDHNNPYLRLARVKSEEVSLEPRIVLFHDVIHDSEIKVIQDVARPLLRRSKIAGNETDTVSYNRVSKTAFIREEIDEVIRKVNLRGALMTNLITNTAEALQVLNYGIGGHYTPHLDAFGKVETNISKKMEMIDETRKGFPVTVGDRLATLLFYMSDVTYGGATVFPLIGAGVTPRKGSAVFWYNILPDGTNDVRTVHSACPVLLGSKWACNKWYHY